MAISKIKDKSEVAPKVPTRKPINLGDYVYPAIGFFVFIMLTIFVYVPMIFTSETSFVAISEERDGIERDKKTLNEKMEDLTPVSSDIVTLNNDLRVARTIIPLELDVSDFAFYVDRLAAANSLKFIELNSSNVNVQRIGSEQGAVGENVYGVTGPIVYEGEYDDILNFLDRLQSQSPYIVETSSIDMRKNALLIAEISEDEDSEIDLGEIRADLWRVEITITGYYIGNSKSAAEAALNPYQPFVPYTVYTDVLEIFKQKSQLLQVTESEDSAR